jgi:hypothetical protein
MSGSMRNLGDEYRTLDCSDRPVRMFSTLYRSYLVKT